MLAKPAELGTFWKNPTTMLHVDLPSTPFTERLSPIPFSKSVMFKAGAVPADEDAAAPAPREESETALAAEVFLFFSGGDDSLRFKLTSDAEDLVGLRPADEADDGGGGPVDAPEETTMERDKSACEVPRRRGAGGGKAADVAGKRGGAFLPVLRLAGAAFSAAGVIQSGKR
jgi:hypothetical protein